MESFRCKSCDVEFESDEPRPPCPHGCKLPIEEKTPFDDYVTTEPVRSLDERQAKKLKRGGKKTAEEKPPPAEEKTPAEESPPEEPPPKKNKFF